MAAKSLLALLLCIIASMYYVASQETSTIAVDIVLVDDAACVAAKGKCLLEGDCSLQFTDQDKHLCAGQGPRIGCCRGVNVIETLCKNQDGYCTFPGESCPYEKRINASDCPTCCKEG